MRQHLPVRRPRVLAAAVIALGLVAVAPTARAATGAATYVVTHAPTSLAGSDDAGEPSVGSNWKTGNAMFQAGLRTYRVGFDPAGNATFTDRSSTLTSLVGLDPILFTDARTSRTFVSQLLGACSLIAFTDDDGATYTQNPVGCGLGTLADHQTVGGGAFAPGLVGATTSYPDITYYCAQANVTALCAASHDGGLTYGAGVPIYTALACSGLHGHVAVAPDGTAYVPNADCNGRQGFSVSKDNGLTWVVRTVPGSSTQSEGDPAVGVGAAGTAYLGFAESRGAGGTSPDVSVYRNGVFSPPYDVSNGLVKNVQFPQVVAGDDGRAAFAFLGTTTAGDDQATGFAGVWNLYVSTTLNGGLTWSTVQANPASDPVQRGCISLAGTTGGSPCRNLLDFMGVTVDKQGNVIVGYADGCDATCAMGGANNRGARASVAKQTSGSGLFALYDGAQPTGGTSVLGAGRAKPTK